MLGEGVPLERGHENRAPSFKNVILPLLACLMWQWLQIGTDVRLIIKSTCNELFRNVNIDDLEWPWIPKIGGSSKFFCDFGLWHTFQEWIAPKWLEIDLDNLHVKFSALDVDFSSQTSDSLGSRRPAHAGVKLSKKWLFIRCWLV